ncbi:c-type cytochrome biogenesis protein CcsB [Amphibiibacter pelophylacis]|uniref:C-type cytochrome biogenesis protein CcsB n=1 Tax=Amphibiibacter pelophylacis TaxID=1799477 RepID=A0ACC6NYF7_9BURK
MIFFDPLRWLDRVWLAAVLLLTALLAALGRQRLDGYELIALGLAGAALALGGWHWRALQALALGTALLVFFSLQGVLPGSQGAVLAMAALLLLATVFYALAWLAPGAAPDGRVARTASRLAFGGVLLGVTATLLRGWDSHLIAPGRVYVPVSNLYEVLLVFAWATTLLHLALERRWPVRLLGVWPMAVVSAAVAFLLWTSAARGAQAVQPLVPALQSGWMALHVPANLIGYAAFALAAAVGLARLLPARWQQRLPPLAVMDEIIYRAIALGFAFFTTATILGALWAAEAWGGYWSWDPKETWALIVWLNYAAWLHAHLSRRVSARAAAAWALVGLLVTTFAFLGVNLFLSGLHSYGRL